MILLKMLLLSYLIYNIASFIEFVTLYSSSDTVQLELLDVTTDKYMGKDDFIKDDFIKDAIS